ncbi:GNAT family N-acetyltransferase [Streptomyces sp. NPDC085614]|uniref:GNAT family N-acetyltransferase n=1 Tax=Streptomyces sp. NPDC085614 TaxID=3365733 RepID=UPI0037D74A81
MNVPIEPVAKKGGLTARPMIPGDQPAVLALIDADRLLGQHPAREILTRSGESPRETEILVVCDEHGRVAGAVRCRVRPADGAGLIVWLHGREDFEVIAALIALARARLGHRTVYACTSPATATDIPGLPVEHRAVTARALAAAGFSPASARQYFQRDLETAPPAAPAYPLADVTPLTGPPGWRLELTCIEGRHLATATLLAPTPATAHMAVLSELSVRRGQRRRGIGSHLLGQILHHAHDHGARHLTATIPEGDIAAARLLAGAAFLPVDTLTLYHHRL